MPQHVLSKNKVAVKVIEKSKLDKIELVRTVVTTLHHITSPSSSSSSSTARGATPHRAAVIAIIALRTHPGRLY